MSVPMTSTSYPGLHIQAHARHPSLVFPPSALYSRSMETKKTVIPVKGMTCVNCAAAIQKDLSRLSGVLSANVNFANEKAVVEFDPDKSGIGDFVASIRESGYQPVTDRVTILVLDLDASRAAELGSVVS